jgi:hypothetical protein
MKTIILLISLFGSFSAFAAEPVTGMPTPNMAEERPADTMDKSLISKPSGDACKADREKFCKDVKPSEGALLRCMKTHKEELSAECKAKGEWMKSQFIEKTKEIHEACSADAEKFCKDAKEPHEKMKCLHAHAADLSAGCKQTMPAHMHHE